MNKIMTLDEAMNRITELEKENAKNFVEIGVDAADYYRIKEK